MLYHLCSYRKINLTDCGTLNIIGRHNLIERSIRRCDFVEMGISLLEEKSVEMGMVFEVFFAQTSLSKTISQLPIDCKDIWLSAPGSYLHAYHHATHDDNELNF